METVTVNKFRENLKSYVEEAVTSHVPLKVSRRAGEAFIVMSEEDWQREQETLYVLQNQSLMQQIADSMKSHTSAKGLQANEDVLDEILSV